MRKPFLKLVAEDIKNRFGHDLSDIAIVFNNHRPITYLKKHLADAFGKAIWSPHFFTIQDFLKQSSSATEASALTQFFYLFELHNQLLVQEGKEPEILEEFYPIAEIILRDFGQLDYDLAPIDKVYTELYDTTRIDLEFQFLSKEQQDFIRQFWQSFSVQGHTGIQQRFLTLWKRLPSLYKLFKDRLTAENQTNFPTIYRDLAERNTSDNFITTNKQILFVGFNALNKAEATLFRKWQDEGKALFYFDTDSYYVDDSIQEAGLFIRRNIQQTGLLNAIGETPDIIGSRQDEVFLYGCIGQTSQTKVLHDLLIQHAQDNQTSAVLLADENLLVPLLQSLPDIDINITTGYPLTQSPLYGLIELWMDAQMEISHFRRDKLPYQLIDTFVNHPLTKVAESEKNRIQKIVTDKQLFEIDVKEIQLDSTLPDFFAPIENSALFLPRLEQLLTQLMESMDDNGRIQQINKNLLGETVKALNQLYLGMLRLFPVSLRIQAGLIKKAFSSINSAIEGNPLKGLQIMGLLESRCLNFDHIYVLGANEGVLPSTSHSPTFLPNSLRMAYGLPIVENQDALSAYLFYRHFQYSDRISLFYNQVVNEKSSGEESRFIKQLKFESKLLFTEKIQQQPIAFPKQPDELVIEKKGEIWEKLIQKYVRDRQRISATAFTSYLQSPLTFFFKHVAEIKEPPSISQEFEMNKLGTVIHDVMERIFLPYKGTGEYILTKELTKNFSLIDRYVMERIGLLYFVDVHTLEDLNSLQKIMHKIASEYVRMYLQYDIEHYKAIQIIELENNEDYVLDFPILIDGKTESLSIYGIIDRVDEVITHDDEAIVRIVDYKTGGDAVAVDSLDKAFAINTSNKALVQTLFYAYIFEQKLGIKGLEPHLYIARNMREQGTLFHEKKLGLLSGANLSEVKNSFIDFLKNTLEEIFDPAIPFRHVPEAKVYDSDPYKLFYPQLLKEDEE